MENITHDNLSLENLPHNDHFGSHKLKAPNTGVAKPFTYHADPYLLSRKRNGRLYYYYRRGRDQEVYLGTADTIMRAVREYKLASDKNDGSYRG